MATPTRATFVCYAVLKTAILETTCLTLVSAMLWLTTCDHAHGRLTTTRSGQHEAKGSFEPEENFILMYTYKIMRKIIKSDM